MFSIHLWPLKNSNGVLFSLPSTLKRVPKMSQREQYCVPSGRKVLTLYRMSYGISFKLDDDMMTSRILGMIWSIMRPTRFFFYKNILYKNIEAQDSQKIKNILRISWGSTWSRQKKIYKFHWLSWIGTIYVTPKGVIAIGFMSIELSK